MKLFYSNLFALILAFACTAAWSDDIAKKGRALLDDHKDAVLTVELVLTEKISYPGAPSQEQETTSEVTGTIIGADGLAVLSMFTTDPTVLVQAMMAGNPQMSQVDMSTEIDEAHYLMPDGSEITAEVVLRDKDLDMVFVRPTEPVETEFHYLDLNKGVKPQLLDHLVTLRRLSRVAGRTYAASIMRLEGIVERPRTFYIGENAQEDIARLGAPTFTIDGELVGVTFVRFMRSDSGFGTMGAMLNATRSVFTTVILPAEDILESAKQVPPYDE